MSITGVAAWVTALTQLKERIKTSVFADKLADLMRKFVHVRTGYLKESIFSRGSEAGATAYYAGYEADRGGSHDFVTRAINALDVNSIVEEAIDVIN